MNATRPAKDVFDLNRNIEPLRPSGTMIENRRGKSALPDLLEFKTLIDSSAIVLFRGFDIEDESLTRAMSRLGSLPLLDAETSKRIEVFDVYDKKQENSSRRKSAPLTNAALPFHWDIIGDPTKSPPPYAAYYCVHPTGDEPGGQTLFCDTSRLLNVCPKLLLEKLGSLKQVVSHGETLMATWPLIQPHPISQKPVLRMMEPWNSPNNNRLQIVGETDASEISAQLMACLYDCANYSYEHSWAAGDLVVIDNRAVLHARREYHPNSQRHLKRIIVL